MAQEYIKQEQDITTPRRVSKKSLSKESGKKGDYGIDRTFDSTHLYLIRSLSYSTIFLYQSHPRKSVCTSFTTVSILIAKSMRRNWKRHWNLGAGSTTIKFCDVGSILFRDEED